VSGSAALRSGESASDAAAQPGLPPPRSGRPHPAGQALLDRVLPEVKQLVTAVMGTSTTMPSTPCWTT